MKKTRAITGVILVLALIIALKLLFRRIGFSEWQVSMFGAPLVSSVILFFIVPFVLIVVRRDKLNLTGLQSGDIRSQWRLAFRAASFLVPTTFLFPLIAFLESSHTEVLGAVILTIGFLVAGALLAVTSRSMTVREAQDNAWPSFAVYAAFLIIGLIACQLLFLHVPIIVRIITAFLFVGFLEEFLFRGCIQSQLNDVFGTPYRFQNVDIGTGMFISAALFGLFHPISALDGTLWPWALWTAAIGLVLGFLREKSGSFIAPAIAHGFILLPSVIFGATG